MDSQQLNQFLSQNQSVIILISAWSLVWKGFALWFSAKRNQRYWFIPLLVINFFGLPEIIYLFFFQKEGKWVEKIKK